jgi:hypothetical protein
MCNNCRSDRDKYGYCSKCGKEICEDCASPTNRFIHKDCLVVPVDPIVRPYTYRGGGGGGGRTGDVGIKRDDTGIGFGPL